ncbi:MAG: hypothetical protein FWB85_07080 [Chitinispirillia bacterium]|nr:hypothetical protein [Chitinispirillia bacterium]MCL2242001.1 hypothetical protein [Chitinispirillia bacterium]
MLKRMLLALTALTLLLAASCGPSYHLIQVRSVAEAELLQAEALAKNLRGDEIASADTYLAMAKSLKSKESADNAELAAALYRIALARHSVEESAGTLEKSEAALADSRMQVAKYQDILTRVNSNDPKEAAAAAAPGAPEVHQEPATKDAKGHKGATKGAADSKDSKKEKK